MAVRNAISSGHYVLSTIHADKAASIPSRMYSLLETNIDISQFLKTIHRYVQIGVHIRGYQDVETKRFIREVAEVCEFYVSNDNVAESNIIYRKTPTGQVYMNNPTKYLLDYLSAQGVLLEPDVIVKRTDNGEITNNDLSNSAGLTNNVTVVDDEILDL